jgi:GNAT superfamily N-acetyltransferase
MSETTTAVATPEHATALLQLFARTGSPCHCRWWHFGGDKNVWLDRCANAPRLNAEELRARLDESSDEASGVVALAAGRAVGWMKLCPAAAVPKLYEQRLYRALPCFSGEREHVFVVGCFLVDEGWRRRGLCARLLDHGIRHARERGARAIEAFPRRSDALRPDELWTGPASTFLAAGFEIIHDFAPYPVLRRNL